MNAATPDMLAEALKCAEMGLAVIPVLHGTKEAAVKWSGIKGPADGNKLRLWWRRFPNAGIAVLNGDPSDGVFCRDFDCLEDYYVWAEAYPELAAILPTAITHRGMHVWGRCYVQQIRDASKTGAATIDFGNGELRGSGYTLIPPSVHPSGTVYRWQNEPTDFPFVGDLVAAGFIPASALCVPEDSKPPPPPAKVETPQATTTSREPAAVESEDAALIALTQHLSDDDKRKIEAAMLATQPPAVKRRRKCVFAFARHLQGIADFRNRPPVEFKPLVLAWWRLALPIVGSKDFITTWTDFATGWGNVKYPVGEGPLCVILEKAMAHVPNVENDDDRYNLLVALCRELQIESGDKPFFLDCRSAARSVGTTPQTAARWFKVMQVEGDIELVKAGEFRRASEWRFVRV